VLLLDTLEASNATLDLGRERLDVARGLANKGAETSLDQRNELGVLGENAGGGCAVKGILCRMSLLAIYEVQGGIGTKPGRGIKTNLPRCWKHQAAERAMR
jgi:hypothetical protein